MNIGRKAGKNKRTGDIGEQGIEGSREKRGKREIGERGRKWKNKQKQKER